MKVINQWSALGLYLGTGAILGSAVTLTWNFDRGMAVGGVIAIISAAIYAYTTIKSRQMTKVEPLTQEDKD